MAPREVPRARSVLGLLARFASGQGVPAAPAWLLDCDVVEALCVRGCRGTGVLDLRDVPVGAVSAGRAGARPAGAAGDAVRGGEGAAAVRTW